MTFSGCSIRTCAATAYIPQDSFEKNDDGTTVTIDGQCVVEGTCGYSDQFAANGASIRYGSSDYTDISVNGFGTAILAGLPTEDDGGTFDVQVDLAGCETSTQSCIALAVETALSNADQTLSPEYENYKDIETADVTWNDGAGTFDVTIEWRVGKHYVDCGLNTCMDDLRRTYIMQAPTRVEI